MIVLKDRHHSRQQTQLNAFILIVIAHCELSLFRFMLSLAAVDGVVSVTWSGGGGGGGAGNTFKLCLVVTSAELHNFIPVSVILA